MSLFGQNPKNTKVKLSETKVAEFANSIDPDETAHYEPSHLDIRCLSSSL